MMRRALEWFGGSVLVYAAMAACSGGTSGPSMRAPGAAGEFTQSEGGQPATGDASHQNGAGISSAGSPVPDAMAAGGGEGSCGCEPTEPAEPTIVEAECGESAAGTSAVFAVADFPGKTAAELAAVVAVVESPAGIQKWPSGFVSQAVLPLVKDGSVAVACGTTSAPSANAVRVTFILP